MTAAMTKIRQAATPADVHQRMSALAEAGKLNKQNADLHWLYQQSVQNVDVEVKFIDRVFSREHGRKPSRCWRPRGWAAARATRPWAWISTRRPWSGVA
jgi:hypothetical protein